MDTERALLDINRINPQLEEPEPNEHCRPVYRDASGEIDYTREPERYIGASHVPMILGACSPSWGSAYSLMSRKLGLTPRDPVNEPMEWGLVLEPVILRKLGEELGVPVCRHNHIMKSQRWHWLGCLPDGLADAVLPDPLRDPMKYGQTAAWVQAKNCAGFEKWEQDETGRFEPMRIWVQIQAELAVSGDPWEYVVGLLNGSSFRWARVPRDDEFIEEVMIPKCEEFVGHLERGEMIEPDFSEATTKAIIARFPHAEKGKEVTLPARFVDLDDKYRMLKDVKAVFEQRMAGIANQVREAMGDANRARVLDRGGYWNFYDLKGGWVERFYRKETRSLKRQPPKKNEADGLDDSPLVRQLIEELTALPEGD